MLAHPTRFPPEIYGDSHEKIPLQSGNGALVFGLCFGAGENEG